MSFQRRRRKTKYHAVYTRKKYNVGILNDNNNNMYCFVTEETNTTQKKSSSMLEVEDYVNITCEMCKIRK